MTNHTFRNALVVWFVVLIVSRESQSFTSARTRVTVLDTSGNVFPSLRPVRRSHNRPEHHLTSSHANSDNDPPNFRDEESNPLPTNHVPWSSTEDHELTSLIPLYTTPIASVNNIAIHATFWSELSSSSPLLSRRGRTEWDCRHRASQLYSKSGTTNTNRQKHGTNSETWKFSPPLITDWEYTSSEPTDGSLTSIIRGFVNGRKVWFRVQEEGILEEVLPNTLEGKLTTLRIPYVVANGGRVVQLGTAGSPPATTTAAISIMRGNSICKQHRYTRNLLVRIIKQEAPAQLYSKSGTTNTNRQKHGTSSETWKASPPLITDWEYTSSEPTDGSLTSIIRGFVNGRKVWFRVQEKGILEEVLSNTLEGKLTTLRIPYVVANGGRVVQLGTAGSPPATTTAAISDHEGQRFLDNSGKWWVPLVLAGAVVLITVIPILTLPSMSPPSLNGMTFLDDSGKWWVPLVLAGAVVLITVIPMLTLPSMSPPSLNGMTISSNAPIARTLSINQQQQQQQQRTQIQMPMLTRRASVVRVSLTMEEQVGRQQLRVKAAETRQNWESDVTQQQQPFFNLALRKEEMKLRELNQKLATTQRQTTQPTLTTPLQQRFL
eukprot:CAMPEP_0194442370 /NCGR_PEP_ID=MMETSP0176-20130528/126091_1 /TAXON_ID=216777 /ORGANISM="Proboscia alata, Strain PI-D3" /LENGTH=603 /DNA_ID=CAMNT_0039268457 /DNA_START=155 /DNA_END=1968 /DNA_ORIENTATION=-